MGYILAPGARAAENESCGIRGELLLLIPCKYCGGNTGQQMTIAGLRKTENDYLSTKRLSTLTFRLMISQIYQELQKTGMGGVVLIGEV